MGKPTNLSAAEREAVARATAEADALAAAEAAAADAAARDATEAAARADAEREAEAELDRSRLLREEEDAARRAAGREALDGHAFLRAPADVTGASAGGESYQVRDDGLVEVRAEHVDELLLHGFAPLE